MTTRWMLAFVTLAALAAAGCQEQLTPQAQQLLRSGYTAYDAGQHAEAVTRMDQFLAENGRSSRVDEAYYLRGLAYRRLDKSDAARGDLQAAVAATGNPQLRANAFVALGDMAFADNDMAMAEDLFRRALAELPGDEPPAEHAHFRLGSVLQRQGKWSEADVQFDRVTYLAADKPLGQLAGRRTHCVAWTVQAGAFGDRSRAQADANELKGFALDAELRPVLQDRRLMFLVQVGRYATYEQAAAALPAVRARRAEAFAVPTP